MGGSKWHPKGVLVVVVDRSRRKGSSGVVFIPDGVLSRESSKGICVCCVREILLTRWPANAGDIHRA